MFRVFPENADGVAMTAMGDQMVASPKSTRWTRNRIGGGDVK
jgi:hypothetical protein